MSEWNIPGSAAELFDNGEAQYFIKDRDYAGDNVYAMGLFVESVGIPPELVETDDGTQIVICNGEKRLVIDSGGLGDFHLHGYDVSLHENQPGAGEKGKEA